ncbi:hypothetical protein Tco_1348170 [Tanacetum coccineum]
MGSITSLKCVLTQEHLDAICAKYFVPEEVHPQLPSSDATMHERPTGKVGMYTRFFDYANYRIPFSTFFVSVLTHFRIPFSQLSVFGSAKVSHFEILCRVCNIEPSVSLFRYFYTHNYKNGWFGFTKRPNVRACYSKNLDSVKNWNDHFFWVDEFVVPANARFSWFSGSNIVKDRAPAPSEYNVEHVNTLIAQASPFLRFPEEFLCWVGISRNYLLNKDTYPRFEYENGEEMDLNAFIRTADPRKVRIVERPRAEHEGPIVTVAKHRTVTLLPNSVVRPSRELSASVEREFVGDVSVGDGGDEEVASVVGQDNVEPSVPITDNVGAEIPRPKCTKKKRVTRGSERTLTTSHPPKRLRADYGTTGGSATRGKSPSVLNRLLQDSRLMVEQGVPALPTLLSTSSFPSEIFKSLSFRLDRLCHLAILCLDQHAHTLHHLESLLTISLDRLDIFEGRSCISEFFEHEHVVMNPTPAGMRHHHLHLYIQRISLTGFPAQSVGSSNTDVLDLPCLLVLITGTSQSRQHGKSESDSYYLSDYVVNSFTGPLSISS